MSKSRIHITLDPAVLCLDVLMEINVKDDGNGKYRYRLSENAWVRYTRSYMLILDTIYLFQNGSGKFFQLAFIAICV